MSSRSVLLATLSAAALTAIWHCAEAIEVPEPGIMPIDGENSDLCIPLLPPEDPSRLNVSYTCSTTRGSVVWLLGDYEMVDRDQFLAFGVLIEDSSNGSSRLTLQPNGAQFLRDSFSSDIYDISCITVLDEVNTRPSPTVLTVYYAVPPVDDPVWEVTSCGDDGSLTVHISYESISEDKVCDGQLNYTITLSNGGRYEFAEDDDLEMDVTVMDTADLSVAMTVCSNGICRNTTTQLSDVTCNRASVRLSECNEDGAPQTTLLCNTADGWSCQLTNDSDGNIAVVDLRPDETLGGQTRRPLLEYSAPCSDDESDDCELMLPVLATVVPGIAVGLLIGAIIGVCIMKKCAKKTDKVSHSDKQKLEESEKSDIHLATR